MQKKKDIVPPSKKELVQDDSEQLDEAERLSRKFEFSAFSLANDLKMDENDIRDCFEGSKGELVKHFDDHNRSRTLQHRFTSATAATGLFGVGALALALTQPLLNAPISNNMMDVLAIAFLASMPVMVLAGMGSSLVKRFKTQRTEKALKNEMTKHQSCFVPKQLPPPA